MNRLPTLLLSGLLCLLLSACASLGQRQEPLRVNLSNLRVIDATLLEQRYLLTLRLQNPNRSALRIEGLSFELELNEQTFGTGVSSQAVTVPAFGDATIDVQVVSTVFRIFQQIQALESRQDKPLSYRMTGRLALADSLFSVSFDESGEIELPQDEPSATP